MNVTYLNQENRFYVRLTPEACTRLPEGVFNPTASVPVYALRVEGEGAAAATYLLVPAADGEFHWLAMADCRLARR